MRILAFLLLMLAAVGARADDRYPSQTIRLIVAFPAGGVSDMAARVVAEGMREKLGVPVIVENRAGGGGLVGNTEFVRSKPDGYTLLFGGLGGQVLPPLVNPRFPFDPLKDYVPVAMVSEFVNIMIVNKDLPVKTVQEFIAYAKARPGKLNFASSGMGVSNHLTAEMFMLQTGLNMVHVPYKGAGGSIPDLHAGHVHLIFENLPPALGSVREGFVKGLAVTSDYRASQLPDLPTVVESGLPNFKVTSWNGVYAPRGAPAEIRKKLSDAIVEVMKQPAVQERFRTAGYQPLGLPYDQFERRFKEELDKWRQVVVARGVKVEQ
jgi:tripartite-type tricarboxylate transporter receptor subunit TctC